MALADKNSAEMSEMAHHSSLYLLLTTTAAHYRHKHLWLERIQIHL